MLVEERQVAFLELLSLKSGVIFLELFRFAQIFHNANYLGRRGMLSALELIKILRE